MITWFSWTFSLTNIIELHLMMEDMNEKLQENEFLSFIKQGKKNKETPSYLNLKTLKKSD